MKERVQIQLEPDDLRALRRVAAAEGRSVAAVVREATAEYLAAHEVSPEAAWERALALAGAFSADVADQATDVAREHDRYLADVAAE
ncbi:MAG TPA: CopG family transcriptional regulator [Candidatus Limnocylindrales bacterium]